MRSLRADMSVRWVATDHPETRPVFTRYGEPADRKVFGHLEPLDRFAQRRGVPLEQLLTELSSASGLPIDHRSEQHERGHRPFIITALVLTLTVGAAWGAHLLVSIGLAGRFEAVEAGHVVAHGASQLWSFAGIFIAGIALRFLVTAGEGTASSAASRRLLLLFFIFGVVGAYPWSIWLIGGRYLAVAAALSLLAAALLYAVLAGRLLGAAASRLWGRFVLTSAGWLIAWGLWTLWLHVVHGATGAGSFTMVERQVVIELALFGVAIPAVYGFGARLLPGLLATGPVREPLLRGLYWTHLSGLVLLFLGRAVARGWLVSFGLAALAAGPVLFVAALGFLQGRPLRNGRPELGHPLLAAYIRLAFFWLALAMLAFAGFAVYESVTGQAVPHALTGAARHAITVGFLTTMIMGVGQRLLPILDRTVLPYPGLVGWILAGIGIGNLLRVTSEVATLFWPPAFPVMTFSALLELTAIILFTIQVIGIFRPPWPKRIHRGSVDRRTPVALLLAERPDLEDRLLDWGVDYLERVRHLTPDWTLGTFLEADGHYADILIPKLERELARRPMRDRVR